MGEIQRFEGGFLLTNSYLFPCEDGGHLMIDAPADSAAWLDELDVVPKALVLTHQHFDHVLDAAAIAAKGVPIYAWRAFDRRLLLEDVVREWGMPFEVASFSVDKVLAGLDILQLGATTLSLAHLPGHSPDSLVIHHAERGVVFAGDTLFAGSTGRADLPGGDFNLLSRGIREKLYTLDPSTRVFPGHGPETQVGVEAASNPIVRNP
ncbi:MAG: MBL fold metallo-hydrolase [Verrucomicrobiales bacterium]